MGYVAEFDALLGPFEGPYPADEVDMLTEADDAVAGRLEGGSREDAGPEGPEEAGEDGEALLVDAVPELGMEELTGAEEAG